MFLKESRKSECFCRIRKLETDLIQSFYILLFVFNFREIINAYVYDIIVPENGEPIRIEITSGSTLSPVTWYHSPLQRTVTHVDQIYSYLSSPKLR